MNLTDGLDGLSGGTVAIAFVAYMLIALLNVPTQANLALLCALIIGALLGFLWFNVHPAQIFIGDSGALSLGATLAVTALITGQILVLPLIGIIFVVETLSVILQVAYFKLTGGKRLFRMTPLHHHFELGGWDEEKITIRFWIVGILAALLGVTLFLASLDRLAVTTAHDRRRPTIDPDALTMAAVRDGRAARPAGGGPRLRPERHRPGPLPGRRRRAGDGLRRPPGGRAGRRRSPRSRGGRSGSCSGPDVDPAAAWAGAALVTTSPSINPDYPTTEPRLRAALQALVAARAAGDPTAPALVSRARPVPAPVRRADHRRDRDEGQDDDGLADRRHPRRRPGAPGRARAATSGPRSSSACPS